MSKKNPFFILLSLLRDVQEVRVKQWKELSQYFGINERFQPPASSRPSPKVQAFVMETIAELCDVLQVFFLLLF